MKCLANKKERMGGFEPKMFPLKTHKVLVELQGSWQD